MIKCRECEHGVFNKITESHECGLGAKDISQCPNFNISLMPAKKDVVDELCKCRHLRSEHNSTLDGLATGHGSCTKCNCVKFTWISFLYTKIK